MIRTISVVFAFAALGCGGEPARVPPRPVEAAEPAEQTAPNAPSTSSAESSQPEATEIAEAEAVAAQRIVAIAHRCVDASPAAYPSVGGSPLDWSRASAHPLDPPSRWLVHVPEQSPTTRPQGRDLYVDASTETCERAMME